LSSASAEATQGKSPCNFEVKSVTEPLISVVIPTRNRPDTLVVCLQAMRHHLSQQIEIVVQDNSTNGETQAVVADAAARDQRIRYCQAPYPTSQRHNFELGLAAARGQYLAIIGDDDGYVIGSLDWLADRLVRTPVDAVRWNLLHYVWPSLSADGEGFMDFYPAMCLGGSSIESGTVLADKIIHAKMNGSWENILVYHGMISRRVYERMKAKTNGVFFPYPMPDVYAHNVIPFFCDTYLQVNDIVSIYGVSGHSAGASWTSASSLTTAGAMEGNRWMTESVADEVAQNLPWHPEIRTLRYHDFAAFKVAEANGMLGGKVPDLKVWTKAIMDEIEMSPMQIAPWLTAIPKAAFDSYIFDEVRRRFERHVPVVNETASNKKSPTERILSLRVRALDETLPDDVEGAMLAIRQLIGDGPSRFETVATKDASVMLSVLRACAHFARKRVPSLTSSVLNSPMLPGSVWRFLKQLHANRTSKSVALQSEVSKISARYTATAYRQNSSN